MYDLVTFSKSASTIYVDEFPVFYPSLDAALFPDCTAYDYAERWETGMGWFDKSTEFEYYVFLPSNLLGPVRVAAQALDRLMDTRA
jgi:hypothetical protein